MRKLRHLVGACMGTESFVEIIACTGDGARGRCHPNVTERFGKPNASRGRSIGAIARSRLSFH